MMYYYHEHVIYPLCPFVALQQKVTHHIISLPPATLSLTTAAHPTPCAA
jgi:hypothetical protein